MGLRIAKRDWDNAVRRLSRGDDIADVMVQIGALCAQKDAGEGARNRELNPIATPGIRAIHQASRESYGAPRVHVELLAQKVPCCRNTVAKLMRRAAILPRRSGASA